MANIALKHTERLHELKGKVESWSNYFDKNIRRYKHFIRLVFDSALTQQDRQKLDEIGKPSIEFNILEPYISRMRAEFAQNVPSLSVRAADGFDVSQLTPQYLETLKVVEAHVRCLLASHSNDALAYNVYTDQLAGGFSVIKVMTDYVNERSFEQNIYLERPFDVTLCGFDPLARDSHKGDGRYYFDSYPMLREDFAREFGGKLTDNMKFTRNIGGFSWSYSNDREEIVLIADLYEKVQKESKIMLLSNGMTLTKEEYETFLAKWEEQGRFEQPPQPVGKYRKTTLCSIERYRFCENEVFSHEKTFYRHLPGVFVDGNSMYMYDGDAQKQMTRPFVYHAEGIQRLKNFAGQTLANELENMVMHKWIAPVEAIPEFYTEAYKNPQKASVLLYNMINPKYPEMLVPPPREVARIPTPPEVTQSFSMSDEMTQVILGSFNQMDAMKRADLSGVAIARGALQSNQNAVPFLMGYLKALQRVATIYIDLMPKFYRTPRSVPIMDEAGMKSYKIINKEGSLFFNYDPDSLNVEIDVGANFAMQKEMALRMIKDLSQSMPSMGQFFNQMCMPEILDNIDIRGIDQIKAKAAQFMQMQQQQQAQQSQMAQQMTSQQMQLQQIKMAQEAKKAQSPTREQIDEMKLKHQMQVDDENIQMKEQEIHNNFLSLIAQIKNDELDNELKQSRIDAENARSAIEAGIAIDKHLTDKAD